MVEHLWIIGAPFGRKKPAAYWITLGHDRIALAGNALLSTASVPTTD